MVAGSPPRTTCGAVDTAQVGGEPGDDHACGRLLDRHGEHRSGRGLAHQRPAPDHGRRGVLDVEHPGVRGGGQFADAVSEEGVGPYAPYTLICDHLFLLQCRPCPGLVTFFYTFPSAYALG